MKKYIIYLLPLLALLSACKDLDKYPQDAVSSEVYFKDATQLEQYTNQFYTLFPSAASMYNEVSDEIAITDLADEVLGTRTIPSDASGTNWNWSMLRHINYLLEHANQCDDPTVALEYEALARFFRAYFYYDRIRHYGDVPWIDRPLGNSDEQLYAPRDDRKVVMKHVIEDLDFAIANMTTDKSNVYRANCYAAMVLKSRICLFEGTFRKYHKLGDWEEMLEQAANAAKQVMDQGPYQLYTEGSQPYRSLFTLGKVQGCPEYILARCYSLDVKLNHNVSSFTISPTTGKPGFTKRLVNQYLNSDGTRFTDRADYETVGMGEEMSNRDPRMEQTMLRPGHYIRVGETEQTEYSVRISSTGYQLIKYVMDKATDTYNQSDCDMPLFRLAEAYLNFAEAKAELGTFTQADADISINKLRDRVGMPHMMVDSVASNPCKYMESLYPNVSQENKGVILEVRRERDVELVQEGFRYWDLMRWKEGKAFEQPYLGLAFKGVSQSATDSSGLVDVDLDGHYDLCVWKTDKPFGFGIDYMEVGKEVILSRGLKGGNILSNGSTDNLNNGRQWREDRDYLYPIPIRERVLSNGAIKQNPGWDDGLSF